MTIKTEFSRKDIINILSSYYIGELKEYQPIKSGSVQTNYYVQTTKGRFVIRYYENRSKNSVLFEVHLLKFLKDNNYPCPEIVKDRFKECMGTYNRKPYVVFEFVEGVHIEKLNSNQEKELIKNIARLHNITKKYKPLYKEHRWNYSVEFCEKLANLEAKKINTANSKEKLKWFKTQLSNLQLPRLLPKGICHCDFHYSNILFKDGKFNALLDFDDANYTYLLYDIVCLVDPFISEFNWETWKKFKIEDNIFNFQKMKETIAEYIKYRPLKGVEKRHLFDLYKLSILIDCIWFFERGSSENFYERRKIEFLDNLGREKFYEKVFDS
ncbi:homoserine kinase [Sporosalibacterium faouarense]|uniref:homoserine kinase n=1 Tax=Sporosalibacterium faouarense TaxID=516123 RepID=UPI00141CC595|nr:homoserine kinase [Sporosalibacterium faouarense]MTI47932.1 homoserine kinase [Bacillota bacterium]